MFADTDKSDRQCLPLLVMAQLPGTDCAELITWARTNTQQILARLRVHGAILFRGFDFHALTEFEKLAVVFCPRLDSYVGGNSPRCKVAGQVFTATEYPHDTPISMHNEASYLRRMPQYILFHCAHPAASGGQTPLADCRRVLQHIDPAVRNRFARLGVRYFNKLHGGSGIGRSWMDVFQTRDRAVVEACLEAQVDEYEWTADGGLRTSIMAPAIVRHPVTAEQCWINQAEQWHPSSLPEEVRGQLLEIVPVSDLPHNAWHADGSALLESDLHNIREVMAAEQRLFSWRKGDVLLCDNVLVMHGRCAYEGTRSHFVVMG